MLFILTSMTKPTSLGCSGCWEGPRWGLSTCRGSSGPGSRCPPRAGTSLWRTSRTGKACLDPEQEPNCHVHVSSSDTLTRHYYTISYLPPRPWCPWSRSSLCPSSSTPCQSPWPRAQNRGRASSRPSTGSPACSCWRRRTCTLCLPACSGPWSNTTGSAGWCTGQGAAWK